MQLKQQAKQKILYFCGIKEMLRRGSCRWLFQCLVILLGSSLMLPAVYADERDDFFDALRIDDFRSVQTLMLRGLDVNIRYEDGSPALVWALKQEAYKCADLLFLGVDLDVHAVNASGENALMMAALKGQEKIAKQLVKLGAKINKEGWTPLHYAVTGGKITMIEWLLEQGADIDARAPNGRTPLMLAALYANGEVVSYLLKMGANVALQDANNQTALQLAQKMNREAAEYELRRWNK